MKKFPYVKEYTTLPVSGLEVMKEQCSFMGSKMMDIEDNINIGFNIIPEDLYTYNNINDPIEKIAQEKILNIKKQYSYDILKQKYVTIEEDKTQNQSDRNFLTHWLFTINTEDLLRDYLYHELIVYNKNTAFTTISNNFPTYDITELVKKYIDENLIKKYRFKSFDLYTSFKPLKDNIYPSITNGVLDNDIKLMQKTPVFDIKAIPLNKNKKDVISIKPYMNGIFHISYKQQVSSLLETFIYYFNVQFEKI